MSLASVLRTFAVVAALAGFAHQAHASTVDAIAVDDDSGTSGGQAGYGVGEGDSAHEAQHMAVASCREHNQSCKLVLTYRQCGAYASSRKWYGTGTGESEHEARRDAIQTCGHDACRIVVSDCVGK